jgi:kojibiose phosphorylase
MTVLSHPLTHDGQWLVVEERFDPSRQRAAETMFSVGNGRFSTRGSLEEGHSGDQAATLMHGLFAPHPIVIRELVNLPDWTALEVVIDGERFSMARGEVTSYRRVLDLKSGLLRREVSWTSPAGVKVDLCFERFASLAEQDVGMVRVTVMPVDEPAPIEIRAALPGTADNDGLSHIELQDQRVADDGTALLAVEIREMPLTVALAAPLGA